MTTLNETYAPRLESLGIRIPEVLLPRPDIDLGTWAVVACDQYTSDEAYWDAVDRAVGSAPSTLRLVLPELYLEKPGLPDRVTTIHATMRDYLARRILQSPGEGLVYIQRTTDSSGLRQGLLLSFDLEQYSYASGSKSLIRATEGTIVDRIPPRLAVRREAPLELPHIMILIDDPALEVIEGWNDRVSELERLYDVALMQQGGALRGYRIADPAHIEDVLGRLERLMRRTEVEQATDQPLFWAMGDGNHSLATAKASWEEIKARLRAAGTSESDVMHHPARWALAEVVNIHSPGLRFEPIHRVVFCHQHADFRTTLEQSSVVEAIVPIGEDALAHRLETPEGANQAGYFDGRDFYAVSFRADAGLPTGLVDQAYMAFREAYEASARIDFIHGWDDTKKLCGPSAVGLFLPVIARERLFNYVDAHGPLPRKSFSMGDAEEKRYYMEARRIVSP